MISLFNWKCFWISNIFKYLFFTFFCDLDIPKTSKQRSKWSLECQHHQLTLEEIGKNAQIMRISELHFSVFCIYLLLISAWHFKVVVFPIFCIIFPMISVFSIINLIISVFIRYSYIIQIMYNLKMIIIKNKLWNSPYFQEI